MIIISTTPAQKAINSSLVDPIVIQFDEQVDSLSVDQASVTVSTKKTSIIQVDNNDIQPQGALGSDSFFSDEFTGIVEGVVSVSQDTLIFTPKTHLQADTDYTVNISSSIASTNGNTLGKINYFTFKTASSDLNIEELPIPDTPLTTIIGTNLSTDPDIQAAKVFYIKSTTPKAESFLVQSGTIKIIFNKDLSSGQENKISVLRYDLFSDYPPVTLTSVSDYTITTGTNDITIVLTESGIQKNSIYEIIVDGTIQSIDSDVLGDDYSFTYINDITPYYTSTKLLRLKAGTVLTAITDVSLALMIFYASLEADEKLYKVSLDTRTKGILKAKYALYSAIEYSLINNYNFGLHEYINKKLSEFSLAASSKTKVLLYNKMIKEAKEFKTSFDSFLNFAVTNNSFVMQGSNSKTIGRMWMSGLQQPGLSEKIVSGDRSLLVWNSFAEAVHYGQ